MSDLIKRQDAINKFVGLNMQVYEGDRCVGIRTYLTKEEVIYAIDELPSVEPEWKWIPVTEALPEDMDRLLATIVRSDGEKRVRSGHYYKGYFMMDNGDTWNETDKGILAWMPLPEPWKGNDGLA